MKKKLWILIIAVILVFGLYIYSRALQKSAIVGFPEDRSGKEASSFLPDKIDEKPAAKGSADLNLTGPVWVGSKGEKK